MSLDFGSILGRAWRITWNHKVLWIYGILASLGGGGGGGSGPTSFETGGGGGGRPELPPQLERFFARLENGDPTAIAIVVGLVCLVLLIGLVFFVLSIIGRGGLIGGVQLADARGQVTFGDAWSVGVKHFWTLFLIGLLIGLAVLALGIVLIGPGVLLAVGTMGIGALCLIPLVCVFVVLVILLSIIAYFAQIAAVVENLSVGDSLRRSWELLRANLGAIIVLGIILAVVGGIAGFVIALPLIAVVVPPVLGLIAGEEAGLRTGIILAAVCFLAYLPVLLVFSGILQTWVTASWTLAYQTLTRPAAAPSLETAPPPAPA